MIGGGPRRALAGMAIAGMMLAGPAHAQLRLADESDRLAFRAWFVLLADAAFYQPPAEVVDCAALVRYAMREALRPHTPEWQRRAGLPVAPAIADVVSRPAAAGGLMPLFPSYVFFSGDADARYRALATGRLCQVIRVADHGIGIEPKHHERIFQIFERLHGYSKYPGSGVGLAIARRAVERMNGRIWVESELGRGRCFCLELPKA